MLYQFKAMHEVLVLKDHFLNLLCKTFSMVQNKSQIDCYTSQKNNSNLPRFLQILQKWQ